LRDNMDMRVHDPARRARVRSICLGFSFRHTVRVPAALARASYE